MTWPRPPSSAINPSACGQSAHWPGAISKRTAGRGQRRSRGSSSSVRHGTDRSHRLQFPFLRSRVRVDLADRRIDQHVFEGWICGQSLKKLSYKPASALGLNLQCSMRQLPSSADRSRQGTTIRASHSTASTNSRSSAPLRPRPPPLATEKGSGPRSRRVAKGSSAQVRLPFSILNQRSVQRETLHMKTTSSWPAAGFVDGG